MANQARITSTDALETFRASLIVFLTKARRSLDNVGEDVRRTRQWLQHDQMLLWEGEMRRRSKALERAQQELTSARLGSHQDSALMARQAAVNKAKRALDEAEVKVRMVKKWNQNFDHSADPVVKRLESLRELLDQDMPKAISYLVSTQKTIEAYADTSAPLAEVAPVATPAPETGGPS